MSVISDIKHRRDELRHIMKARRLSLSQEDYTAANHSLWNRVIGYLDSMLPQGIHLYLAIPESHEPDCHPLIMYCIAHHIPIAVPVIEGKMLRSLTLPLHQDYRSDLIIGQFKVPKPKTEFPFDDAMLSHVIVPLLAFDIKLNRLGYGKGFYDRFLIDLAKRQLHPQSIGVAFDFQCADFIPQLDVAGHRDIPLDVVITDKSIYLPSGV